MENTQLTPIQGYDAQTRMVFADPQKGSIPDSKPKIEFQRINIQTINEDGTRGDLILETERLFSFGVSENTDPTTHVVNGYVMPICLHDRISPSKSEIEWVTTFNNIVERCVDYILENKHEIGCYELTRNDLKKFNPLYYKKENIIDPVTGKITGRKNVDGVGPTLYAKLIFSKKQDKFVTQFYDMNGKALEPLELLGKYCHTRAAIKIESIFIGSKISLQVKLYECEVEPADTGMRRMLTPSRPASQSTVIDSTVPVGKLIGTATVVENEESDSEGSLVEEVVKMNIAPTPPPAVVPKPPLRKPSTSRKSS